MEDFSIIDKIAQDKNPFRTPEGYFESLTQRTMQRIQQEPAAKDLRPTVARQRRLQLPKWVAAASIAAITIATSTYLFNSLRTTTEAAQAYNAEALFNDDMLEQALDYEIAAGIVDNNKIQYYLTEAE